MVKKGRFLKKILTILIILILISTITASASTIKKDIRQEKNYDKNQKDLKDRYQKSLAKTKFVETLVSNQNNFEKANIFSTVIKTECNNVEKTKEIFFGLKNRMDVDNNPDTGQNGKDIEFQYLLLPWFDFKEEIGIGLIFTLNVVRIGDEIKNNNLSVSMQTGWNEISFGFWSPEKTGNSIPESVRLSFGLKFFLTENKHGFSININPKYENGKENKEIVLFSDHKKADEQRFYSLHFDPAVEAQVDVFSTKNKGEWKYSFNRKSSLSSKVTSTFSRISDGERKDTSFIIDSLPDSMSFTLGLTPFSQGGGSFLYESSKSYNVEMIVESNRIGVCRYGSIKNTPKSLYAEWDPSLSAGFYSMEINSEDTDFVLMNSLENPTVNLEVNNLKNLDFDANWNLSNPGEFTIQRKTDFVVDLDFEINDWTIDFYGKPLASYFYTNWYVNVTGFLELDTNWQPLSQADLLIKSPNVGIRSDAETLKAEDFRLDWTIWPPKEWNVEKQGEIDFADLAIDVFYNGKWYHIWPL